MGTSIVDVWLGAQVDTLLDAACNADQPGDVESRKKTVLYCARYLRDVLYMQREFRADLSRRRYCSPLALKHWLATHLCLWFGKRYGNLLVFTYAFVKLLFVGNLFGQFVLMNKFLGSNYTLYGAELLRDLLQGRDWAESGNFPRITLCDFEIRRLGNVNRYSVQCVLPINMFAEKIFILLWFWFVLVALATLLSVLLWTWRLALPGRRRAYIKKSLVLGGALPWKSRDAHERRLIRQFVFNTLRLDGVFLVRLIALNAGELIASEIVLQLWNMFCSTPPDSSTADEPQANSTGHRKHTSEV